MPKKKTLTQQLKEANARIAELETNLTKAEEKTKRIYARNADDMSEMRKHHREMLDEQAENALRDRERMNSKHKIELALLNGATGILRDVVIEVVKGSGNGVEKPDKSHFAELMASALVDTSRRAGSEADFDFDF